MPDVILMRHIDLSGHQRDNFLFRFGEAAYIESGSGSRYLQVSRTDDERMLLVRMYLKVGFSGHFHFPDVAGESGRIFQRTSCVQPNLRAVRQCQRGYRSVWSRHFVEGDKGSLIVFFHQQCHYGNDCRQQENGGDSPAVSDQSCSLHRSLWRCMDSVLYFCQGFAGIYLFWIDGGSGHFPDVSDFLKVVCILFREGNPFTELPDFFG